MLFHTTKRELITKWATFHNKSLEDAYNEQYLAIAGKNICNFMLVSGFIFFSIVYYDCKYNSDFSILLGSAIARTLVFLTAIVCFLVLKKNTSTRIFFTCTTVFPLVLIFAYIYILTLQAEQTFVNQGMAIMVIIFCTTAFPNQWINLFVVDVIIIVAFLIASTTYIEDKSFRTYSEVITYLLLSLLYTAVMQHRGNVTRRERFLWEQNLQLQSITDKLTGIYNRLWFDYTLSDWCSGRGPYTDFSLVLIDIDNFKEVNDTLGHLAGDRVLVECTRCLRDSIRSTDLLARWGGEEFVLLLPKVDDKKAWQIAENIRKNIEAHHFEDVGAVTCSFGVVSYTPGEGMDTLIQKADEMLYKAKKEGKNRVFSYD